MVVSRVLVVVTVLVDKMVEMRVVATVLVWLIVVVSKKVSVDCGSVFVEVEVMVVFLNKVD